MTKTKRYVADRVAERTRDAYSFEAFGEGEWRRLCRRLMEAGYDSMEVEAIVRSKVTRWARDAQSRHRGYVIDVLDYIAKRGAMWTRDLTELLEGTFPEC